MCSLRDFLVESSQFLGLMRQSKIAEDRLPRIFPDPPA
jgi:hypothetical protein